MGKKKVEAFHQETPRETDVTVSPEGTTSLVAGWGKVDRLT